MSLGGPDPDNPSDIRYFPTSWIDDGNEPVISDLHSYSLDLMVGGNDKSNSQQVSIYVHDQIFTATNNVDLVGIVGGTIAYIHNGFYIQMTARASTMGKYNGTILFYSDRFSLDGGWGRMAPEYAEAAKAVRGTGGPGTESFLESPLPTRTYTPTPFVLSNEAKAKWAGGTVGVVLALVIAGVLLCLPCRKKRRAKSRQQEYEVSGEKMGRSELGPGEMRLEADSGEKHTAELATDWTGWEAPALLEVELSRPPANSEGQSRDRSPTIAGGQVNGCQVSQATSREVRDQ